MDVVELWYSVISSFGPDVIVELFDLNQIELAPKPSEPGVTDCRLALDHACPPRTSTFSDMLRLVFGSYSGCCRQVAGGTGPESRSPRFGAKRPMGSSSGSWVVPSMTDVDANLAAVRRWF
ncbi:hypothetical protein Rhe02_78420 [Rhizocola hellebori]|uniref:Uncharacterized protein n=1 Tax=Rhizocola hellebori TaxID=1392758 RepID=A0A8J3VKJ3_9ACTN|nr:hypothetical protein Rhe02_78420 [Rhizocola hellebori]